VILAGVAAAHVMFSEPVFFASQRVRSGGAQLFSEFVATFGLLAVIWGCARGHTPVVVPFAVAGYITAAYWFTASTSFANPAVTLAEASQGGLAWGDVAPYVAAQVAGAFGGVAAAHVMFETPLFIASRHARACLQALSSTQWPMACPRPVSSASGMNCAGVILPRVGWCQRRSASTPRIA